MPPGGKKKRKHDSGNSSKTKYRRHGERCSPEQAENLRPEICAAVAYVLNLPTDPKKKYKLGSRRAIKHKHPNQDFLFPLLAAGDPVKMSKMVDNAKRAIGSHKSPKTSGLWDAYGVEKVAFPETLYGNALLMESEYESITKMALDSAEGFSALDRPALRKLIRQTLQLRQRRINSGRYPNLPPLSATAIGIVNGPSEIIANPTDTWFLKSFYPRTAKYGLMEKIPKYTDVQRTATYDATKLVADMESVLAELSNPKINIMSAEGKWVPLPDDPSWDPGYCSRA
jgi:hypothetical protein